MAMTHASYPVRIDGQLAADHGRWLWLVKWLLAIPHYFVLALLWIAFALLWLVALVAIVVTGRYPRGIFDFNVGVLRWTWRVAFYGYSANGTDRYPPFTLADVPDYPAHLEVAYPERLSRGLVLVKWWLLAIPHYVIVGLFLGGGAWAAGGSQQADWLWGPSGGLVGLLVLVASVVLLFTGRYPRSIFDFVLGLDRWALRVAAYAGLMTDRYPPFRLDMGEREPGDTAAVVAGSTTTPADVPHATTSTGWSAGRIVSIVLGSLAVLIGAAMLTGGGGALFVDRTMRDHDGFLLGPSARASTNAYAIVTGFEKTSDSLVSDSLGVRIEGSRWLFASDRLGTVRVRVEPRGGKPLFVGVAPTARLNAYLGDVRRSEVADVDGRRLVLRSIAGSAPQGAPGAQPFWSSSATGAGERSLTWHLGTGSWSLVVMNADASGGVATAVTLGARLSSLGTIAVALLAIGALLTLAGAVAIASSIRSRPKATAP